jgi:hypothetical protein
MGQDFLELGIELGVKRCLKASNLVHRIRKLGINITQAYVHISGWEWADPDLALDLALLASRTI